MTENIDERKKKAFFSTLIVLGICISWVGTTQFAKSSAISKGFSGATFMLYISASSNMILFPTFWFVKSYVLKHPHNIISELSKEPKDLTFTSIVAYAGIFFVLYFIANYLHLKALWFTSASVVNAVFSATPAFVYVFGCMPCFLNNPIEITKVIAVTFAVGGTLCFYANAQLGYESVIGVIMSIGSSLCAALYKVLLQTRLGNSSVSTVTLLLSLVGVYHFSLIWILVLILDYTNIESISNPPWLLIFISILLGLTYNFLVNFGVCYTSALFVSLGTLLGIPLGGLVDHLFRDVEFHFLQIVGAICIAIGFILILFPLKFSQINPITPPLSSSRLLAIETISDPET
eukprot:c18438_g1_i2.p1 GENE.c18438_g1_i2~~c18438_g1_i2.p1  ORF type:complete len:347 (+),score=85.19 c18438_g1_i2:18-1058(+)